ncbi:hypothetical protein RD792_008309 [Penstemon davidsonii]|uniref:Exonuclease domain-containing protein n=1 Tax=Penstemon davidsonii TaxID=160366 RepID=A0ABR0DA19_9LAMI|nr:hypothetical protein RD792_008309 [Penstemon davidsonii]
MAMTINDRSEIVFFDVERRRTGQGFAILEFGAILVCPKKLVELRNYSTLVRPADPSLLSDRSIGITKDAVVSAPPFAYIADAVYDLLHGRIWAGHNILRFDSACIREAFAEINRTPPEPKGIIDSLALLTQRFGSRAGDMKLSAYGFLFSNISIIHFRSLDDVRMNLEVLKYCATVLFLESSLPDIFTDTNGCIEFLEPEDVSLRSISVALVPIYRGTQRIQIWHKSSPLQLLCRNLKVRFGISTKYVDDAGLPRSNIVLNAPPSLEKILDEIDGRAQKLSLESGSSSEWRPVVTRKADFINYPTVRLELPTVADGDMIKWETEIYKEDASATHMLVCSRFDEIELESIFTPGNLVNACFSLDSYDYQQKAGILLVAKKLIIHSTAANALFELQ